MRLAARAIVGTLLAVSSGCVFAAQGGPEAAVAAKPAQVSFQFERAGVPVPRFTLRVNEDELAHPCPGEDLGGGRPRTAIANDADDRTA